MAAGGTTVLLTTHYLDEAEALADRLAVIAGGRIVAAGTPSTLAGRETAPATVTWSDENGDHSERTQQPTELVVRLASSGCEVNDLQVTRPSLEDIYLELIGAPA